METSSHSPILEPHYFYWDVDALADAIYGLLSYPGLGKMAGEEGLEEVNQLKWENAALKVEDVYKDALGII